MTADQETEKQIQAFISKVLTEDVPLVVWADYLLEDFLDDTVFACKTSFYDYFSRKIGDYGKVSVRCNNKNNTPITKSEGKLIVDVKVERNKQFTARRFVLAPDGLQNLEL